MITIREYFFQCPNGKLIAQNMVVSGKHIPEILLIKSSFVLRYWLSDINISKEFAVPGSIPKHGILLKEVAISYC